MVLGWGPTASPGQPLLVHLTFLHYGKWCGRHDNILGYSRNTGNLSSAGKMRWGDKKQLQVSIKVLGENERARIYQQLPGG
jgi:hypothetical protein